VAQAIGMVTNTQLPAQHRQSSKDLNVDISNTTGPIHTGFVAFERNFSWLQFSITILGAAKYHDCHNKQHVIVRAHT
jgi:hypothetical protein